MKRVSFSAAMFLGLGLIAAVRLMAADIVLNEIQADNQTTIAHAGDHPDWIELYNNTSQTKDLGGMSLSDDPLAPRTFVFPSGTLLAGHQRLLVWCDDVFDAEGLHTGFALNAEGQTLTLYAAGAVAQPVDSLTFGPQVFDLSIGRVPDGTGAWQLCQPTPWKANVLQALGAQGKLKINEWMASPNSGDDWFELYNPEPNPVALGGMSLTDTLATPGLSPIPALSFIGAAGLQLFWADQKTNKGAIHANFKLSAGGEAIGLYSGVQLIDAVSFGVQAPGDSEGRLPDGAVPPFVRFTKTPSPAESNYLLLTNLVVNEILAHTDPPLEDAVEFYNPTTANVNLSGWYLSNTRSHPKKYRVPDGTVVPAKGYVVFYEYQFDPDPLNPNSFTFNSAHGDEVVLSEFVAGNPTGFRVYEKFPATENGVSLGRYLTSDGVDHPAMSRRTFGEDDPLTLAQFRLGKGATNAFPLVGPVVVTELMYHPPDLISGAVTNDNTLDEFIELKNLSARTVSLFDPTALQNTWRLGDGVDYRFPLGTSLASQEHLLLVSFDPATNATALAAFRSKYVLPSGLRILGPYKGKLDNGGETIDLLKPDPPQLPPHPDAGFVPYIRVDRIHYSDATPWPAGADGTGQSLQRLYLEGYGNEPANWSAAAPTPGRSASQIAVQSIRISGSSVIISFIAEAGRSYTVQVRGTIAGGAWQKLVSYSASAQALLREASDTLAGPGSARFYRLVSPAIP